MIDPAFWQSESIATLPIVVRYFFIGLFSNADDQGRMKAHPALLRSKLYPYDDISLDDIASWIAQLVEQDSIILYNVEGKEYIQIRNWWRYQRPRWAWPSQHPTPEGWTDRVHYRKGNAVMTENWQDNGPDEEPTADDSEPTVEPEWNHSEPTVEPAPSISTSIRISDSTSGSKDIGADAPAANGSPEKRASKPKAKEPAPVAVEKFREVTLRYPNKALWSDIQTVIGSEDTDLTRWQRTVKAWIAMGWNPTNVKGMLQHFRDKRIPGDDMKSRGSPGGVPEPASYAALRALAQEEGFEWQH